MAGESQAAVVSPVEARLDDLGPDERAAILAAIAAEKAARVVTADSYTGDNRRTLDPK